MLMGSITPVITPSAYAEPEQDTVVRTADETGPISKHEIPTEETPAETPAEEPAAEPTETTETAEPTESTGPIAPAEQEAKPLEIEFIEDQGPDCSEQLSPVGWLICPIMEVTSKAVDSLYDVIENLLVVQPLSTSGNSSIYTVWNYCLGITNVVFIIFFLIVIYSQVTGFGISNYGIKKVLPKLIVAVILVNLSFHICALAVDVSNIIGASLRGFFENIPIQLGDVVVSSQLSFSDAAYAALGGAGISIGVGLVAFEAGALFMMIPAIIGGLIAIVSGLITIAIRQAVVILLVMISPLALVCYMLPNTENLFKKWKNLFTKMLVFYPLFSLLFGASNLAGWAIIVSALNNGSMFMVILGLAVQVFPLFACWSLMKMSGTFLSSVNNTVRGLAAKPLATNRAWAESMRSAKRAKSIASGTTPYSRLQQYLANRKTLRELDMESNLRTVKSRASIYAQHRIGNYKDVTEGQLVANGYTRRMKRAKNLELEEKNAAAHVEHTMTEYKSYYGNKNAARIEKIKAKATANGGKLQAADTRKIARLEKSTDLALAAHSAAAFTDYGRSLFVKEIDDENDVDFLTNQFLEAFETDEDGNVIRVKNKELFQRYVRSVGGEDGEVRVLGKVIQQAAKVESKQRAEFNTLINKYGHNGYNKRNFRNWIAGYYNNDDGWATDTKGSELVWNQEDADRHKIPVPKGVWTQYDLESGRIPMQKDRVWTQADVDAGRVSADMINQKVRAEDLVGQRIIAQDFVGSKIETIPGEIFSKAPHRVVRYDKVDDQGRLYFDFRDQYGNKMARLYRGKKGENVAFIKEALSNFDIPIGDPINDVYNFLAGRKPGDPDKGVRTEDIDGNPVPNYIGLDRYSTTIGRALLSGNYKGNAAWAGAMFASMVGNRQIKNPAEHAIAVLDSLVKTMKPGGFNTQNPASVNYLTSILDPRNWDIIFSEKNIRDWANINNSPLGGETWDVNEKTGSYFFDKDGMIDPEHIKKVKGQQPTYEEMMNVVKRKYLFPAAKKISTSVFNRMTSNTADNQKPGTADAESAMINMFMSQWKVTPNQKTTGTMPPIELMKRGSELVSDAREFRGLQYDGAGKQIFPTGSEKSSKRSSGQDSQDQNQNPQNPQGPQNPQAPQNPQHNEEDEAMDEYHTSIPAAPDADPESNVDMYYYRSGTSEEFKGYMHDYLKGDALRKFEKHCGDFPGESLESLYEFVSRDLMGDILDM